MSRKVVWIHHFEPISQSNGPGKRAVIWVQGCTLGCPGCFNSETHPEKSGNRISINDLLSQVLELGTSIDGITISGGEPLQQADSILEFAAMVKQNSTLSILLFTGYTWNEIRQLGYTEKIKDSVDVLIAGRYIHSKRVGKGLLGSINKTVHLLTDRYSKAQLDNVPEAEVFISPDGSLSFSGIDPVIFRT